MNPARTTGGPYGTGQAVHEITFFTSQVPLVIPLRPSAGPRYLFEQSADRATAICIGTVDGVYLSPAERAVLAYLGTLGWSMDVDSDGSCIVYNGRGISEGILTHGLLSQLQSERAAEQRAAETRTPSDAT